MSAEQQTPTSSSQGDVLDPGQFQRFSTEQATVVRVYSDDDQSVVVWNLEPGQENPSHVHPENAHTLMVLQGSGAYVTPDGSESPIKAGDFIIVPRSTTHGIRNTGATRLSYLAVTTLGGKGYVRNIVGSGGAGSH